MKNKDVKTRITAVLFCVLLVLASVSQTAAAERTLVVGGSLLGVRIGAHGVCVTDFSAFESDGARVCPASEAGLLVGDLIVSADSAELTGAEQFARLVNQSQGAPISLVIVRGGERLSVSLSARRSTRDGAYHLGLLVRDELTGVGTLTFYDPQSGTFGALGHSVCAPEESELWHSGTGSVYAARAEGVVPSVEGAPGELRATLYGEPLGSVKSHGERGVFGVLKAPPVGGRTLAVCEKEQVTEGEVTLLCTLTDGEIRPYTAELVRLLDGDSDTKNFLVRVTDDALLERTGGIVQGMSGSPILQNGKLVGALTHVLVGDPTRGYGIFIENMLAAAE